MIEKILETIHIKIIPNGKPDIVGWSRKEEGEKVGRNIATRYTIGECGVTTLKGVLAPDNFVNIGTIKCLY
ncbi:hypothetical protein QYM36_008890 [Artemia franciscana]|uniref:Uncharacterized protein n=1 Tax=Artemia franciscana TaxID=6661 RepID=A0AA88HSR0_ARTSF|nr:hypothetical protein QYM36_008890 [Artemia franciscana]